MSANIFGSAGNFPAHAYHKRPMVTLESVVGKDAQYDLIKQDVQGAELLVMQGSPKIFRRAKYVIQEVNLYKDKDFPEIPDEKEMDKYMVQLGFNNNEVIGNHEGFDQIDKIYYWDFNLISSTILSNCFVFKSICTAGRPGAKFFFLFNIFNFFDFVIKNVFG